MKKLDTIVLFILVIIILVLSLSSFVIKKTTEMLTNETSNTFPFIFSIDTMKYSRDESQQALTDPNFDQVIDTQMKAISQSGATYVAIDTPYDAHFLPVLQKWVKAARKYNLHVWFRGNFSGWEGWFGFAPITRSDHISLTNAFILQNKDLFENGDIFTACPECENGGPGDPRQTKDVTGFRNFLIDEYNVTKNDFDVIGKQVTSNYDSMNADVATLIMDKRTTQALGGVVVIDHYVSNPFDLKGKVDQIARSSGGRVVLGEFGAPIPDLTGNLTDSEQATWVLSALTNLENDPNLIGMNYWTSFGGSTAIWNDDGTPKQAEEIIKTFYTPNIFIGQVVDRFNDPLQGVTISYLGNTFVSDSYGFFHLTYRNADTSLTVKKDGFTPQTISLVQLNGLKGKIVLQKAAWGFIDFIHEKTPWLWDLFYN